MRKIQLFIIFLLFIFVKSQTFIAKYEMVYDKNKLLDSMLQNVKDENLKKELLKSIPTKINYFLVHSNSKSIYYISKNDSIKKEESIELKKQIDEFSPVIFKNFNNSTLIKKEYILDKAFIIRDSLSNYKVLDFSDEVIKYGSFNAKKVTIIDYNYNDEKIMATYSEEIPIIDGPHYFYGLPGLILELEGTLYKISLVELKMFESNTEINFEEKGTEISVDEFKKLYNEKMTF